MTFSRPPRQDDIHTSTTHKNRKPWPRNHLDSPWYLVASGRQGLPASRLGDIKALLTHKDGVMRLALLPPKPGHPRNSEGDTIQLRVIW